MQWGLTHKHNHETLPQFVCLIGYKFDKVSFLLQGRLVIKRHTVEKMCCFLGYA